MPADVSAPIGGGDEAEHRWDKIILLRGKEGLRFGGTGRLGFIITGLGAGGGAAAQVIPLLLAEGVLGVGELRVGVILLRI